MGSLKNPLLHCHAMRELLSKINEIYSEFINHENTRPKCEVCWQNHAEFESVKGQLQLLVQDVHVYVPSVPNDGMEDSNFISELVKEETQIQTTESAYQNVEKNVYQENNFEFCEMVIKEEEIDKDVEKVEKPFQCTKCDAEFANKSQMDRHMWVHMKARKAKSILENLVKNQTCEICQLRFDTAFQLRMHMRSHKDKPWATDTSSIENMDKKLPTNCCKFCYTSYKTAASLAKHQQFRRDGQFFCYTCNETFCRGADLSRHKKRVHKKDSIYVCAYCVDPFTDSLLLHRHYKKQHPTIQPPKNP